MGVALRDFPASVATQPGSPTGPGGTAWVVEHTNATKRQLEWWTRHGLLGQRHQNLGSGGRRRYSAADVEVVHALAELAALGCQDRWMERAVEAVRATRVKAGEWLVLPLHGAPRRAVQPLVAAPHLGPAWVVPLTPCPDELLSPAGDPPNGTAGDPAGSSTGSVAS